MDLFFNITDQWIWKVGNKKEEKLNKLNILKTNLNN